MSEIEELTLQAEKLLADFTSLDAVKRYKELKAAVENDEYLIKIKTQREKLQSTIKLLNGSKRDEVMKVCKELQIEYDNNPLVINYLTAKEEVLKLIEPLTETKL
ncbi:MAG: YlbF family regulator [Bacilli bacterium]|jgi:cell fate (sporulation/competence/biofilm development) regulator YlbF (YheA/YmcA/DUF963 family)|nr:YlbF family regulator [Bacilli bacterium]